MCVCVCVCVRACVRVCVCMHVCVCWAAKVKLTKTQDRLKGHVNEFMFIQFVGDTIQSVYDIETNGDRQVD